MAGETASTASRLLGSLDAAVVDVGFIDPNRFSVILLVFQLSAAGDSNDSD